SSRESGMAALDMLSEIYFAVTSEFQKKYRFEKKWLDAVSASGGEQVDPGLWEITLRLSEAGEEHRDEIIRAVDATMNQARSSAVSAERLAATKKRFRNQALIHWFSGPE